MNGFFVDVQGTLIDDKDFLPLPGAVEFTKFLTEKNIPFILLTNNTKRDSKKFICYLKNLGFEFEHYLDPLMVLDSFIKEPVAPFGNEKFLTLIRKYRIDYKNPKQVILGLKLYSNDELARIIEYILNGADLVGMHKTSLWHKSAKRYPGLGAVLEMLRYATSKDYSVLGKPSFEFFKLAGEKIGVKFDKITIISDDLYGDLISAGEYGMKTSLVLSGKIKNRNEILKKPDKIYKNIYEILKELQTEK